MQSDQFYFQEICIYMEILPKMNNGSVKTKELNKLEGKMRYEMTSCERAWILQAKLYQKAKQKIRTRENRTYG